jgi:hypothetical protein
MRKELKKINNIKKKAEKMYIRAILNVEQCPCESFSSPLSLRVLAHYQWAGRSNLIFPNLSSAFIHFFIRVNP